MKDTVLSSNVLKYTNLKQNTSINKPKSAHNKPFNKNLSKPISNKQTESCDQKTRYLKLLKNFIKTCFTIPKNRDNTITSKEFDSYKTL